MKLHTIEGKIFTNIESHATISKENEFTEFILKDKSSILIRTEYIKMIIKQGHK